MTRMEWAGMRSEQKKVFWSHWREVLLLLLQHQPIKRWQQFVEFVTDCARRRDARDLKKIEKLQTYLRAVIPPLSNGTAERMMTSSNTLNVDLLNCIRYRFLCSVSPQNLSSSSIRRSFPHVFHVLISNAKNKSVRILTGKTNAIFTGVFVPFLLRSAA